MSTRVSFGEYLRGLRVGIGMTLREFCRRVDESPGNVSRIERRKLAPPDSVEKLVRFARGLGLTDEGEIRDFIDRAVIERGRVPDDILSNERMVAALPLVFRTMRGDRVDDDDLRSLAELIKRS